MLVCVDTEASALCSVHEWLGRALHATTVYFAMYIIFNIITKKQSTVQG